MLTGAQRLCRKWGFTVQRKSLGNLTSNYLQQSETPTSAFQESLPRLPVPNLEDTCARYIASLTPLLSNEELANTSRIVKAFQSGVGKNLHAQLISREETLDQQHSYVHHAWADMYLCDRSSVLLNMNPVLPYVDDTDPALNNQLDRAVNLVSSTLRYFCTLKDEKLNPLNLCMSQFPFLFQSTRIPRESRDLNLRFPESRHLAVLHKGHLYRINVLDDEWDVIDSEAVKTSISEILSDPRPVNENSFGYFTALDRVHWSRVRPKLEKYNSELLKTIDSAIFVLCLDDWAAVSSEDVLKNGLVGSGHNRWFDKSFSLLVTENGKAGVNWEHSWGDGGTIINMMESVHADYLRRVPISRGNGRKADMQRVDQVLDNDIMGQVKEAKQQFEAAKSGYDLIEFNCDAFGKDRVKKFGLSPDSVSQLIFQLAYWRTHGSCVGTYEACSTAAFRSGRTETIRSCTSEMKKCSVAFDYDHGANLSDLTELMRKVSSKHVSLCREAAQGQGFDRHLFALRALNRWDGREELDLFTDPSWNKMSSIGLSTSTVGSPALQLYLAFGAVVPKGYGIGYLMRKDSFGASVSCYLPNEHFSDFVHNLQASAQDIHAVMTHKNYKASRKI